MQPELPSSGAFEPVRSASLRCFRLQCLPCQPHWQGAERAAESAGATSSPKRPTCARRLSANQSSFDSAPGTFFMR
jgi:hypothetical protein